MLAPHFGETKPVGPRVVTDSRNAEDSDRLPNHNAPSSPSDELDRMSFISFERSFMSSLAPGILEIPVIPVSPSVPAIAMNTVIESGALSSLSQDQAAQMISTAPPPRRISFPTSCVNIAPKTHVNFAVYKG